ncbi:hypothetical protein [Sinomonas atrocyanea]|uniref:hypothetical protein n=1 Tax=Sinomonas atrocyanea TaxID=37927 RepID=UPI00285683CD|nr:hypothetical protein [Sinomonas atrocyanea]MDR6620617.1 hypothetical protein [Sinomonas atrocyanea]
MPRETAAAFTTAQWLPSADWACRRLQDRSSGGHLAGAYSRLLGPVLRSVLVRD